MEIRSLLSEMVERGASDLYITTNSPPLLRADGVNQPIGETRYSDLDTRALAESLMSDSEKAKFARSLEMNLAIEIKDIGRFRVNVHRQRESVGIVIRHVKTEIPTLNQLRLPSGLKDIIMKKRGLVLVTGPTGSGKSTSLAAMLDHRNEHASGHVVTVEDPIEFIHTNKKSIFTQREVGVDTLSYSDALRNTLRQAPDVILIGEIRDRESMEAAIDFAESGHLCLGTLHSSNATQALHRVLSFFPVERHSDICMQLSVNLCAIISQRLIPSRDARRVAALEILRDAPVVKELIRKGEVENIRDAMRQGAEDGCKTLDQALLELHDSDLITAWEALDNADYPNELRLDLPGAGLNVEKEPRRTEPSPSSSKVSRAPRLSVVERVLLKTA